MSAFNWILFDAACPSCRAASALKAQTRVASDYAGDSTGRFHDRVYRVGDIMAWWPTDHPRFAAWRPEEALLTGPDKASEACYTECVSCGASLYAVIEFESLRPTRVAAIGPEEQWPAAYPK